MAQQESEPERDLTEVVADGLHEVRRPLALARGYVSVMIEGQLGPMSDRQQQWLTRMEEKLRQTQAEVDRLALLVRLESPHSPLIEVADLVEQAEAAGRRTSARLELEGGRLEVRPSPPSGPVLAAVDTTLLARILDNLLDNALTYSDGPARVVIEAVDDPQPELRIVDSGPGMEAELAERIFERGVRGEHGGRHMGSGIGLHLSRSAAERMGGELLLEWTTPGRGSSFLLRLPPAYGMIG